MEPPLEGMKDAQRQKQGIVKIEGKWEGLLWLSVRVWHYRKPLTDTKSVVYTINGPFPNSYHQINIPGNIGKAADSHKKWTKTKRRVERVASQETWRVSYWSEGGNNIKTYPKKLPNATIRPFQKSNHQLTIAKNIGNPMGILVDIQGYRHIFSASRTPLSKCLILNSRVAYIQKHVFIYVNLLVDSMLL